MKYVIALLVAAFCGLAQAQTAGTINISISPVTGVSTLTPTITWSTTPAAASCAASGGWSGPKAGTGVETVAAITSTTSFTLTCSWGTPGQATVTWTAPTKNTDGSNLTDLAGFNVLYGSACSTLNNSQKVNSASANSMTITGLPPGSFCAVVRAVNGAGVESANSATATKSIVGGSVTASKTVTAAVTAPPVPNPPTDIVVTETTAYNVRADFQTFAFVKSVRYGTVKRGASCDPTRTTGDGFYVIDRLSMVTPRPPAGTVLVAKCG